MHLPLKEHTKPVQLCQQWTHPSAVNCRIKGCAKKNAYDPVFNGTSASGAYVAGESLTFDAAGKA